MNPARSFPFLFLIGLLAFISWDCKKNESNPVGPSTTPGTPGVIATGTVVDAGSTLIGPGGGTITVTKPGTPVDGMQITVPPNSYGPNTRTFQVSYAPIQGHTLGSDIALLSPLITIANGGGYADSVMKVKIPVRIPAGKFAMGFYYSTQTGELEGLPLLGYDSTSVTIGTRHFAFNGLSVSSGFSKGLFRALSGSADPAVDANVVVVSIDELSLQGNHDTGFRPGVDDWEFTNYGSYVTEGGNCAGMSVGAVWYFNEKKSKGSPPLFGRFDNDGNPPRTPNLWQDDALRIKFCSILQQGAYQATLGNILGTLLQSIPIISDASTFDAIALALRVTHRPQLIMLLSTPAGHAMIVYGQVGSQLFIADPNYPGDLTRRIVMNSLFFDPCYSGPNASDLGHAFSHIYYGGVSSIVDWTPIDTHWQEVANKTIGQGTFPAYTIMALNDSVQFQELKDGFTKSDGYISLSIHGNGFSGRFEAYDSTGKLLASNAAFTLPRGNFPVGIAVYDQKGHWVDFRRVRVVSDAEGVLYPLTVGNSWSYDEMGYDSTGAVVGAHVRRESIVGTHAVNGDPFSLFVTSLDQDLPDTGYIMNKADGLWQWYAYSGVQQLIWKYPAKNGDTYKIFLVEDTLTVAVDSVGSTCTVTGGSFSNCIVYRTTASLIPGETVHIISVGVGEVQRRSYALKSNGTPFLVYLSQLTHYTAH